MAQATGNPRLYPQFYSFNMAGRTAATSENDHEPSLVHNPVFKALYQDLKHQLHFAKTKDQLSFSALTCNKELQKWITDNEVGSKIDYEWVRQSLDKLGKEHYLDKNSPGLFLFFNTLLICHGHYSNTASRYFGHDIWRQILEAYYSASGDIIIKELFLVNSPPDLEKYIREAAAVMSTEAVASRNEQSRVYFEEKGLAETWLLECKNGPELERRVAQLKQLNAIYDVIDPKKDPVKQRHRLERMRNENIRKQKKAAIRLANIQRYPHQLGQEIHNEPNQTMIDTQIAQCVAWTNNYVNDPVLSMLEQVSIANDQESSA